MSNRNTVFQFCFTIFVISVNEHLKYRPQGIKASVEAPVTACKPANIVPKIGVYAFRDMCISFVMDITDVFAWENNIKIAYITVRAIVLRIFSIVYDAL